MSRIDKAKEFIKKNEGLRLVPYKCTAGKLTVGYGHNLEKSISRAKAESYLMEDMNEALMYVREIFGHLVDDWSDNVYTVMLDLMFQLGPTRFLGFKKMISAVKEKDWRRAGEELLDSALHTQTPARNRARVEMLYNE